VSATFPPGAGPPPTLPVDQADPTRLSIAHLAPEAALRRLELTIVRKLEGILHGEHLGLLPGPGTELAEARVYRPGEDDVRRMDWSVTARTTVPHVRDVIADRELETWAMVDLSASMDFGTAALEKRDLAVAAVATVWFLTHKLGDRFVVRGGRLRRWPARSGRLALYGLLRSLLAEPRTAVEEPEDDFTSSLDQLSRAQQRRGLRVIVSDFLDGSGDPDQVAPPAWERAMKRLSGRHQVLAVEILDPRELELPDVGVVWLTDPETGETREVNTASAEVRARYAAGAAEHRERVRIALRRSGAAHLTLRTDRDWVADTARFVLGHRRVAAKLHGTTAPTRGATG
jgi:uncharacterized protein (DUF58 family)